MFLLHDMHHIVLDTDGAAGLLQRASLGPDMAQLPCYAVAQFLLSPLLLWRSFVATVLSNALYGLAFSYYHYITFLGYSSLPFLSDTVVRPILGLSWGSPCLACRLTT